MIAAGDRIALPAGVALTRDGLADAVRGECFALNVAGRFVLERHGRTVGEIASELSARFAVEPRRALGDVAGFTERLNGLLLLEVSGRRLLRPRRRPLETARPLAALASVAAALAGRALAAGIAAGALAALALAALGAYVVLAPAAFAVSVGLGLLLHEGGHAAALRGTPACLGMAGLRAWVLHAPLPPGRRLAVALAGPALPAALGALLALVAWAASSTPLALVAPPLLAHVLALSVAGADGRAACGL